MRIAGNIQYDNIILEIPTYFTHMPLTTNENVVLINASESNCNERRFYVIVFKVNKKYVADVYKKLKMKCKLMAEYERT